MRIPVIPFCLTVLSSGCVTPVRTFCVRERHGLLNGPFQSPVTDDSTRFAVSGLLDKWVFDRGYMDIPKDGEIEMIRLLEGVIVSLDLEQATATDFCDEMNRQLRALARYPPAIFCPVNDSRTSRGDRPVPTVTIHERHCSAYRALRMLAEAMDGRVLITIEDRFVEIRVLWGGVPPFSWGR